ncbi:MAG: branched-chain amino acid transaminase [Chitinophagales bacterium]
MSLIKNRLHPYSNKHTYAFIDGNFVKASTNGISIHSQSLHYGLAAFEGMRAYKTPAGVHIFKARQHFDRLLESAKRIFLDINYTTDELIDISYELLKKNDFEAAYIRPLVFAGDRMELLPSEDSHLMICAWRWPKYFKAQEVRLTISDYRRPHPKSMPINAKVSGQYVTNMLATKTAQMKGFDDAILLDSEGYIAQSAGANFFYEKDNQLFTSPKKHIFAGITRQTIIEMAKEMGIKVVEKKISPKELQNIDGAFLTGTAVEVKPVKSIDEHHVNLPFEETFGGSLAKRYHLSVSGKEVSSII